MNQQQITTALEWTAVEATGEGLKRILLAPNPALVSTIVTAQKVFSSRGGFLTSQRKNIVKLTHYGEAKKMAHDSQMDRAKETLKLNHDEPSQTNWHQATIHRLNFMSGPSLSLRPDPSSYNYRGHHSYKP